jgi:hypothetical protein
VSWLDGLRGWWARLWTRRWDAARIPDWQDELTPRRDQAQAMRQQAALQQQTEVLQREIEAMRAEAELESRQRRAGGE